MKDADVIKHVIKKSKNNELVKQFVEEYGIHLCGRFSEFEYYNMDKCIRNAMNKAKELNLKA